MTDDEKSGTKTAPKTNRGEEYQNDASESDSGQPNQTDSVKRRIKRKKKKRNQTVVNDNSNRLCSPHLSQPQCNTNVSSIVHNQNELEIRPDLKNVIYERKPGVKKAKKKKNRLPFNTVSNTEMLTMLTVGEGNGTDSDDGMLPLQAVRNLPNMQLFWRKDEEFSRASDSGMYTLSYEDDRFNIVAGTTTPDTFLELSTDDYSTTTKNMDSLSELTKNCGLNTDDTFSFLGPPKDKTFAMCYSRISEISNEHVSVDPEILPENSETSPVLFSQHVIILNDDKDRKHFQLSDFSVKPAVTMSCTNSNVKGNTYKKHATRSKDKPFWISEERDAFIFPARNIEIKLNEDNGQDNLQDRLCDKQQDELSVEFSIDSDDIACENLARLHDQTQFSGNTERMIKSSHLTESEKKLPEKQIHTVIQKTFCTENGQTVVEETEEVLPEVANTRLIEFLHLNEQLTSSFSERQPQPNHQFYVPDESTGSSNYFSLEQSQGHELKTGSKVSDTYFRDDVQLVTPTVQHNFGREESKFSVADQEVLTTFSLTGTSETSAIDTSSSAIFRADQQTLEDIKVVSGSPSKIDSVLRHNLEFIPSSSSNDGCPATSESDQLLNPVSTGLWNSENVMKTTSSIWQQFPGQIEWPITVSKGAVSSLGIQESQLLVSPDHQDSTEPSKPNSDGTIVPKTSLNWLQFSEKTSSLDVISDSEEKNVCVQKIKYDVDLDQMLSDELAKHEKPCYKERNYFENTKSDESSHNDISTTSSSVEVKLPVQGDNLSEMQFVENNTSELLINELVITPPEKTYYAQTVKCDCEEITSLVQRYSLLENDRNNQSTAGTAFLMSEVDDKAPECPHKSMRCFDFETFDDVSEKTLELGECSYAATKESDTLIEEPSDDTSRKENTLNGKDLSYSGCEKSELFMQSGDDYNLEPMSEMKYSEKELQISFDKSIRRHDNGRDTKPKDKKKKRKKRVNDGDSLKSKGETETSSKPESFTDQQPTRYIERLSKKLSEPQTSLKHSKEEKTEIRMSVPKTVDKDIKTNNSSSKSKNEKVKAKNISSAVDTKTDHSDFSRARTITQPGEKNDGFDKAISNDIQRNIKVYGSVSETETHQSVNELDPKPEPTSQDVLLHGIQGIVRSPTELERMHFDEAISGSLPQVVSDHSGTASRETLEPTDNVSSLTTVNLGEDEKLIYQITYEQQQAPYINSETLCPVDANSLHGEESTAHYLEYLVENPSLLIKQPHDTKIEKERVDSAKNLAMPYITVEECNKVVSNQHEEQKRPALQIQSGKLSDEPGLPISAKSKTKLKVGNASDMSDMTSGLTGNIVTEGEHSRICQSNPVVKKSDQVLQFSLSTTTQTSIISSELARDSQVQLLSKDEISNSSETKEGFNTLEGSNAPIADVLLNPSNKIPDVYESATSIISVPESIHPQITEENVSNQTLEKTSLELKQHLTNEEMSFLMPNNAGIFYNSQNDDNFVNNTVCSEVRNFEHDKNLFNPLNEESVDSSPGISSNQESICQEHKILENELVFVEVQSPSNTEVSNEDIGNLIAETVFLQITDTVPKASEIAAEYPQNNDDVQLKEQTVTFTVVRQTSRETYSSKDELSCAHYITEESVSGSPNNRSRKTMVPDPNVPRTSIINDHEQNDANTIDFRLKKPETTEMEVDACNTKDIEYQTISSNNDIPFTSVDVYIKEKTQQSVKSLESHTAHKSERTEVIPIFEVTLPCLKTSALGTSHLLDPRSEDYPIDIPTTEDVPALRHTESPTLCFREQRRRSSPIPVFVITQDDDIAKPPMRKQKSEDCTVFNTVLDNKSKKKKKKGHKHSKPKQQSLDTERKSFHSSSDTEKSETTTHSLSGRDGSGHTERKNQLEAAILENPEIDSNSQQNSSFQSAKRLKKKRKRKDKLEISLHVDVSHIQTKSLSSESQFSSERQEEKEEEAVGGEEKREAFNLSLGTLEKSAGKLLSNLHQDNILYTSENCLSPETNNDTNGHFLQTSTQAVEEVSSIDKYEKALCTEEVNGKLVIYDPVEESCVSKLTSKQLLFITDADLVDVEPDKDFIPTVVTKMKNIEFLKFDGLTLQSGPSASFDVVDVDATKMVVADLLSHTGDIHSVTNPDILPLLLSRAMDNEETSTPELPNLDVLALIPDVSNPDIKHACNLPYVVSSESTNNSQSIQSQDEAKTTYLVMDNLNFDVSDLYIREAKQQLDVTQEKMVTSCSETYHKQGAIHKDSVPLVETSFQEQSPLLSEQCPEYQEKPSGVLKTDINKNILLNLKVDTVEILDISKPVKNSSMNVQETSPVKHTLQTDNQETTDLKHNVAKYIIKANVKDCVQDIDNIATTYEDVERLKKEEQFECNSNMITELNDINKPVPKQPAEIDQRTSDSNILLPHTLDVETIKSLEEPEMSTSYLHTEDTIFHQKICHRRTEKDDIRISDIPLKSLIPKETNSFPIPRNDENKTTDKSITHNLLDHNREISDQHSSIISEANTEFPSSETLDRLSTKRNTDTYPEDPSTFCEHIFDEHLHIKKEVIKSSKSTKHQPEKRKYYPGSSKESSENDWELSASETYRSGTDKYTLGKTDYQDRDKDTNNYELKLEILQTDLNSAITERETYEQDNILRKPTDPLSLVSLRNDTPEEQTEDNIKPQKPVIMTELLQETIPRNTSNAPSSEALQGTIPCDTELLLSIENAEQLMKQTVHTLASLEAISACPVESLSSSKQVQAHAVELRGQSKNLASLLAQLRYYTELQGEDVKWKTVIERMESYITDVEIKFFELQNKLYTIQHFISEEKQLYEGEETLFEQTVYYGYSSNEQAETSRNIPAVTTTTHNPKIHKFPDNTEGALKQPKALTDLDQLLTPNEMPNTVGKDTSSVSPLFTEQDYFRNYTAVTSDKAAKEQPLSVTTVELKKAENEAFTDELKSNDFSGPDAERYAPQNITISRKSDNQIQIAEAEEILADAHRTLSSLETAFALPIEMLASARQVQEHAADIQERYKCLNALLTQMKEFSEIQANVHDSVERTVVLERIESMTTVIKIHMLEIREKLETLLFVCEEKQQLEAEEKERREKEIKGVKLEEAGHAGAAEGFLDHGTIVIQHAQLSQKLEERLENQSSVLCRLQQYESSLRNPEIQLEDSQVTETAADQSSRTLKARCRRLARFIHTVSDRTRKANRLAHTIEHIQDCSALPLSIPCNGQPSHPHDLARQCKSNLESLHSSLSNSEFPGLEESLVDSYLGILTVIEQWLQMVEHRILISWNLETKQSITEYQSLSEELDEVQHLCEQLREITHVLAFQIDRDEALREKVLEGLEVICQHLQAVASLAKVINQRTLEENRHMSTLQNEMLQLEKSVSVEVQVLEEVCNVFAGEEELPAVQIALCKVEAIQEEVANLHVRCLNQQLLRPTPKGSFSDQTVVPTVDLTALEAKLRILHRQMSYRKQDPGFRQQRFLVRKYDTLLDSVRELSSAGRQCLEMNPLVVAQPENLKEQLAQIQNLFQSLHIQSQRLQSTYSLLEELSASRMSRQHQSAMSEAQTLLEQFGSRRTELSCCSADWSKLLPLLDDVEAWLKGFTVRNSSKESLSRFNIQNLVFQCKEKQAEVERHLPELYFLLTLQSQITQTSIFCPILERRMELCQQQWQHISDQVSSEVKELTSYLSQWQSCQSDLKLFKTWLEHTGSCLEQLRALRLEKEEQLALVTLLECIIKARKLQSAQCRQEKTYRNVEESLDVCQRLGLYDPAEARELRKELADQWEHISCGLAEFDSCLLQIVKQQIATLPRGLEKDFLLLPEKQELAMRTMKSQDVDSLCAANFRLAELRDVDDELSTILTILDFATCHYPTLVSSRNKTAILLAEVQDTVCENETMLAQWNDLEKTQKQISESLTEAKVLLSTAKDALATPICLENAQQEADRIESLHQEFMVKQEKVDNLANLHENFLLSVKSPLLGEELQESFEKLDVHWKKVGSLILEMRLTLVDKLKDWDHYKDLLATVNKLLDEVDYSVKTSEKPVSFLEQAQVNHISLQHSLEILNESVPLLANLENASLKLRRDGSAKNNLHIELQNQYTRTIHRWQIQESSLSSMSAQQLELYTSWSTLERNLSEINHWVSATLNQLQVLDCGRPDDQDFPKLENLRSAVSQHGQVMNDTRNLALVLYQSGLLSKEGCNLIKSATEATSNLFSSLQHALATKLEETDKADKEVEFCHHTAKRVQDCFQTVQDQVLNADFPSDLEAQTKEIDVIEDALNQLITCEMDLILLKDILGQHKYPDSVLAAQVVCLLAMWQDLRIKLCTQHSRLVTYSSASSFAVRCQNLMAVFLRLKISLSKSVPSHYADIVKQVSHLRMLELLMNSHESVLDSVLTEGSEIVRSSLLTKTTEQEKQLLYCLEQLQMEWSTMTEMLSSSLELLEHLLVLWRRYTRAKYSLEEWTQKVRITAGLPPLGEHLPEPDTLETIVEEEDKIEMLLSSWPSSKNIAEELIVSSEDLASVMDSETAESVVLAKCSLLDELEDLKSHLESRRKHLRHFTDRRRSLDDDLNSVQKTLSAIMMVPELGGTSPLYQQPDDLGDCEDHLLSVSECLHSLSMLEPRLTHLEDDLSSSDWHLLRDRHTTLVHMSEATQVRSLVLQQSLLRNAEKKHLLEQKIEDLFAFTRSADLQIDESLECSLTTRIRALEKLQSEVQSRFSSLDGLTTAVRTLLDKQSLIGSQPYKVMSDVPLSDQVDQLTHALQCLKNTLQDRLDAAVKTGETLKHLKEDLENFLIFFREKELLFTKSVWFFVPTKDEIDQKSKELMTKLDEITVHGSKLELMSKLCIELESSPLMQHDTLECESVRKKLLVLQEKYQKLISSVMDKETFYRKTLDKWECFLMHIKQMEAWLDEQENLENYHRTSAHLYRLSDTKEELKVFEALIQNIQTNSHLTENLTSQFCWLSNTGRLDGSGQLTSQFHSVLARWDNHSEKCKKGMRRLRHSVQVWDDFQAQREHLMVWLTELDMKVTRILVSGNLNRLQKMKDLESCQNELEGGNWEACTWEWRALHLHQRSHSDDAVRCETEVAEFRTYWNEIEARIKECISLMKPSITSQEEVDESLEEDIMSETQHTAQTSFFSESHLVSQSTVSTTSSSAIPSSDVTDIESLPCNTDEASSSGGGDGISELCLGLLEEAESTSQIRELEAALVEAETRLVALEDLLQCPTPNAYDQDSSNMNFARLLAACHSTMDVVQHLSEVTQASEMGRYQSTVDSVIHQWEFVQNWALDKEHRFRTAQAQWRDVQSGLAQMEDWVSRAQEQITETWKDTPEDVHKLEMFIQMHKEFLLEMEHINKVAVSVHHLSYKFTQPRQERHRSQSDQPLELLVDHPALDKNPKVEAFSMRLQGASHRLEEISSAALTWQSALQMALLQCSEFEAMVGELSLWLDDRESKARALADVGVHDKEESSVHFNKLLELLQDLGQCEPRVEILQTTYAQLFDEPDEVDYSEGGLANRNVEKAKLVEEVVTNTGEAEDTESRGREAVREARAQLASLIFRLRTLHHFCTEHVHRLQAFLDDTDLDIKKIPKERSAFLLHALSSLPESIEVGGAQSGEVAVRPKSVLGRYYRYMMRVAWASLPIQVLMLLLLGVASLLPMAEEDFSCILTNNFARSFDPMLRYPHGPPPI